MHKQEWILQKTSRFPELHAVDHIYKWPQYDSISAFMNKYSSMNTWRLNARKQKAYGKQ